MDHGYSSLDLRGLWKLSVALILPGLHIGRLRSDIVPKEVFFQDYMADRLGLVSLGRTLTVKLIAISVCP